ncbi:MAG: sugar kinase, partial [Bacteroidota bacterium]
MNTAIFDIGKTNKKFFLFDAQMQVLTQDYVRIPETVDEDGFACDDLAAIEAWMRETLDRTLAVYEVAYLNFSTYGASLVHVDAEGKAVTPLYNYLKPFPDNLAASFWAKYGPESAWSLRTASPFLGMLNSGLQLYWLMHCRPAIWRQMTDSLHFPQYCSFLFSGERRVDYTSLGCHTGLWDMERGGYHAWVEGEGMLHKQASLLGRHKTVLREIGGQQIAIGPGIHDSSAALLPYLLLDPNPFMLLSTGTWSICLNPFSQEPLTASELQADCLFYLQPNGKQVKASRL